MNEPNTQPTPTAALVRQGFGETTAISGVEMQAQALAAQVKAAIEARYILAMRRPRNLDAVRTKLMAECRRPRFADEARYSVPRGRKQDEKGNWVDNMVEGPSIRFAEAAVRNMTNIDTTTMVIYDDANARQVRVTAIDLESNVTYSKDITVTKTQEKRDLRKNQVAIGERYTSTGVLVHIIAIPDSELQNVQAAAESKALRTLILRLVPGDITEDCMDLCLEVLRNEHAKDPRAATKAMCDGFARLGIQPDELVTYLGKPLDQMTPAEYQHLRSLGISLRDGQTSWGEALEAKLEGRPVVVAKPEPAAAAPTDATTTTATAPAPAADPPPAQAAGAKGAKAVTQQVKAGKATAAKPKDAPPATAPATPGPGSAEWEAAKGRAAAAKPEPEPAAAAPEPEPDGPDPHGDPPPPDDVPLPGAVEAAPHATGDAPDWMA